MPAHDIIINFSAGLGVHITYETYQILSKFDTLACLNYAQNNIPTGPEAYSPVPGPLFYKSGDVHLTFVPNSSPVMLWSEWNDTVRALKWFAEEYEALAMVFSVMTITEASKVIGTGAVTTAVW